MDNRAEMLVAGLEQLLAAVHADDPKREILVRVGNLMREAKALATPPPLRRFKVRVDGFADVEVEAATIAKARWRVFKMAQEAGYFRSGFGAFIQRGVTAFEVRR